MGLGKLAHYKDRELPRFEWESRAHRHGWSTPKRGHVTTGRKVNTPPKKRDVTDDL